MYGGLHQKDLETCPPKQATFDCGTNNLPSSEDPETIAKNIVNLAKK